MGTTRSLAAFPRNHRGNGGFRAKRGVQSKNSTLAKVTGERGSASMALGMPDDDCAPEEGVRADGRYPWRPPRFRLVLRIGNRPARRSVASKSACSMDLTITLPVYLHLLCLVKFFCSVGQILPEPAFRTVIASPPAFLITCLRRSPRPSSAREKRSRFGPSETWSRQGDPSGFLSKLWNATPGGCNCLSEMRSRRPDRGNRGADCRTHG